MTFALLLNGETHHVEILRRRPHLVLRIGGRAYTVQTTGPEGDGLHRLVIDGQPVALARAADGDRQILRLDGQTHTVTLPDEGGGGAGGDLSELRAPMPGAVIEVHAAPGDAVTLGAPLITIESMKLQTVLSAPRDGVLAEISVTRGELFGKDQVLARLQEEPPADA